MKRINSLLSIGEHGSCWYKGIIRNGNKKSDVIIPKVAPYKEMTFSKFFEYCIGQYEIYLCCGRNKDKFIKLLENNDKVTEKDVVEFFENAKDISVKLEEIYGEDLKYFIHNFSSKSLKICNVEFNSYKEKVNFLSNNIKC